MMARSAYFKAERFCLPAFLCRQTLISAKAVQAQGLPQEHAKADRPDKGFSSKSIASTKCSFQGDLIRLLPWLPPAIPKKKSPRLEGFSFLDSSNIGED